MTKATEIKPATNSKANDKMDVKAQVEVEVKAQADSLSAMVKTSGAIGPLGLESLAIGLGESTTKAGRPSFSAWAAYVFALSASKPGYAAQNRLAALANKHVPNDHKPVCRSKAKGQVGQAACSYRINAPVAWEIAIGE